jgi:tetratricopeptide (TPR) repeat protein
MQLYRGTILAVGLASLLGPVGALGAEGIKPSSCAGDSNVPELSEARKTVARNPTALEARFRLADTLIEQGCFQDAVRVLEEGAETHSPSAELQTRIRNAKSMLNEQRYFEGLSHAEESAKIQRSILRCSKLGDLEACDTALASKPEDRDVLMAKADALLQASRPAEALTLYRRAAEMHPGNEILNNKIATAEALSRSLAERCQSGSGEAALDACRRALVHGAEDELALNKRVAAPPHSINVAASRHEAPKPSPHEYSNQALAGRTN